MIALIRLLLALLATPFRSKLVLEAENAALRQQVIVLRRKLRGRVKLSNADRLFFVWLYRLFPSITRAMLIIRPDTLVRWHRAGFRRYWRWKSRGGIGRPRVDHELRASQTWRTFLRNHAPDIAAIDLFLCRLSVSGCCTVSSSSGSPGATSFGSMSPSIRPRSGSPDN